jgi:hypothetical protein
VFYGQRTAREEMRVKGAGEREKEDTGRGKGE